MSPTRAKEHQLEDESRRAFANAVPGSWVVRDVQKDYGIDTEVEIFADDGTATGLTFKVQLKGTQSLHGRRPHRSIQIEHIIYWQSLDSAVLVVLYVADSQTLYAKWSFAHDPGLSGYSKKTTTFSFDDDELLDRRLSKFESDIVLYRQLVSGWVPHVVPLRIDSSAWGAVAGYGIITRFRERLLELGLGNIIRITLDEKEPSLTVQLSKNTLRVAMPLNAGSLSLHSLGLKSDIVEAVDEAIDNTLIGLAALLATRDRTSEVLQILTAVGTCEAWFNSEVSSRLANALIEAERTDIGVAVAKLLLEHHADDYTLKLASLYLAPAQAASSSLPDDELQDLITTLRVLSSIFEETGNSEAGSSQRINIARILSARDEYEAAVAELQAAHSDSPELLDDPTFAAVLAANAFCAGMHALSAEMYGRVIALVAPTPRVLAHYADALFVSGKFLKAKEIIDGSHGTPLTDRLSVVNGLAAQEIISTLDVEEQDPRELADEEIASVEADPAVALSLLRGVNATQFMLWMRFDEDVRGWSLGRAALLARLNCKAAWIWVLATGLAYEERGTDSREFAAIVEMGIADASDDYLSMLVEASEGGPAGLKEMVEYAHRVALTLSVDDSFSVYGELPSFD